ncbi:MAG: cytochrome c oxidase assembly factor Coa1 family protein [Actinomycetota bacterium]
MSTNVPPLPPPPPNAPYGYPPLQASGLPVAPRRKKRIWIIVLSVIAGVALLIVLVVAGLVFALLSAIKSSDPYQHAVQVATHDPRAAAALGAPVIPGWYVLGNINVSPTAGNADLAIPVSGSRGKGTIYAVAKKSAGRWTYSTLELKVDGQEDRVNLLQRPDPSAGEIK